LREAGKEKELKHSNMGTILIIIICLLTPILVIGAITVFEVRRRERIRKRLEKCLHQVIEKNAVTISHVEYFRNRVIGIDSMTKKLIFLNHTNRFVDQICIDLRWVVFCDINTTIDKSTNKVDQLFLGVKHEETGEVSKLMFFDASFDNVQSKRLLLAKAREWKNRINREIGSTNLNNSVGHVM